MTFPINPIYKFYNVTVDGVNKQMIIKSDGEKMLKNIPSDPDNIDYQEYLEWAKTNTAEAAD